MTQSHIKQMARAIRRDTYIRYQDSQATIRALRRQPDSLLAGGKSWYDLLCLSADARPAVAYRVVEWFMANRTYQEHLSSWWLRHIKQDLEMLLWDVLSPTPLNLPQLNVYHSGPQYRVFWEDGAAEEVVVQYLSGYLGPLAQSRDWPNQFTTSYGKELVLRRVRRRATVRAQEQSSDSSRPKPWDPSALPPGQSFVSAS